MAIASVGALGTVGDTSSGTTAQIASTTTTISVGNTVFVVVAIDNTDAASGQGGSEVSSVADSGGTNVYTKVSENRYGEGVGAGATVALFKCKATAQLNSGSTVTATFANSVASSCVTGHIFSHTAGTTLEYDDIDYSTANSSTAPGSITLDTPNTEHLFLRAIAAQMLAATTYTKTAGTTPTYTALTRATADTGNGNSSMSAVGEWAIATRTSTTSNPTLGAGRDSASIFASFVETSTTQNLTPSLFTNSQTFYSPTVGATYALTPSLFTDGDTFYSPTVSATYGLTPSLFTNSQTFYSATVSPGAVNVQPSLFTSAQTFYSATVAPGAVDLAPSLFTDADTFYSPTASATYALSPALFTNTQAFYSPTMESASNSVNYTLFARRRGRR